jgi:hypothetical protein
MGTADLRPHDVPVCQLNRPSEEGSPRISADVGAAFNES